MIGDCISDCMYMDAPSTRLQGEMRQPSTELENCACGVRESECGLDRIHGSMQWHAQTRCVPVSMDCMVAVGSCVIAALFKTRRASMHTSRARDE